MRCINLGREVVNISNEVIKYQVNEYHFDVLFALYFCNRRIFISGHDRVDFWQGRKQNSNVPFSKSQPSRCGDC